MSQGADAGQNPATDSSSGAAAADEPPAPAAAEESAPQPTADEPTQQFPVNPPTRQMPQWGGVPQQAAPGQQPTPLAPGPQTPQQPAPNGPVSSQAPAPQQPQWGTAPAGGHSSQQADPFGAAPAAPYAGGYQQQSTPPPGGAYSAAPPPGSGPQFGGPASSQSFQQSGPFGPGDAPAAKNRTPLVVGGIAIVVVIVLLVLLAVRLIGGDDESTDTAPPPTSPVQGTDPADDPTTPAQTDDPTDDPTDQQTDGSGGSGDLAVLSPGEPAVVTGTSGEPEVEIALVSVERGWQPEGSQAAICPDPAGEYLALEFEFTTLPALADGTGSYSFAGFEIGLANESGTALDASGISGLFCLSPDQRAPTEVGPGETFTGWAVIDAPAEASQVLWEPWLDFTGSQPTYAWSIADF